MLPILWYTYYSEMCLTVMTSLFASPVQLTVEMYWQVSDDVNVPDSVHSRRSFSMPAQLAPVKAVRFPTSSRDTLAPAERTKE